ncbi:Uncharacterised protein [Janthinobacterium lividum]|uniref:hypothetical protein n=1 Tax=Janthinobacterium lividum TaxID=29581 RepID=UPI000E0173F5|nr:hypothetical protein [Janthinobacterium lividum]STQ93251.1 Uncharacterised protein [Janthinobacterium lividum]
MRLPYTVLALLAAALPLSTQAQDISGMAGSLKVNSTNERTFVGAISYTQPVGNYNAVSLSYINEGHPENHHRDGMAGQVWLRTKNVDQGLMLGAGIGRYFFFDTAKTDEAPHNFDNDHGWGSIASLQARWQFDNRWYALAQVNRIRPSGKDTTTHLLIGAGYRYDGVPGAKLHLQNWAYDDTLTLSTGHTIVNSFRSESSRPFTLEYRRAAGKYVDWSATLIDEGSTVLAHRRGAAAQLWLIRSLNEKVEFGMGAGPYVAWDGRDTQGHDTRLTGLLSAVARYHVNRHWLAQVAWNRVVTDYHRDADVLLVGVGRKF